MAKIDACSDHGFLARLSLLLDRYGYAVAVLGGLLLGFTVIFPQIGLLEWIVLVPAAAVLLSYAADPAVRLRRIYAVGLTFFLSYLIVTFHWFFYMYPLDYAGMTRTASAVVVTAACVGLSIFQAVGAALIFPLVAIAARGKLLSRRPALLPLLVAALWTSLEWWWAHSGWSGVPWSRLALGQAEILPAMQSAWLFGSYAVSFLIVLVNGYLAYLLLHPDRRVLCVALAGGLFCGNLAFGAIRLATYRETGNTLTVAAIQGNKSSLDYWTPTSADEVMAIYADLSRAAAADGAELIVWPETCIPVNIDQSPITYDYVTDLAVECGVPILVGLFTDVAPDSMAYYNSIVVALPDGTLHDAVYNKRNPVPFGEFLPWRALVTAIAPPLAEINTLADDIPAGKDSVVFDLEEGRIGPLICFDSIYEQNARDSIRNGAEVLAVSTNDSWFRDSRGVWMHHAQAQYRAIETGRYVVRSANTGVSSVITATGEVADYLPALETGYVLGSVVLRTEKTPYTVMGNVLVYLCLLVSAAGLVSAVGRVRKEAPTATEGHIIQDSLSDSDN